MDGTPGESAMPTHDYESLAHTSSGSVTGGSTRQERRVRVSAERAVNATKKVCRLQSDRLTQSTQ